MGAQRRMKRSVAKASGNLPSRKTLMQTVNSLYEQLQEANNFFRVADNVLCAVLEKDVVVPMELIRKPVRSVKLSTNPANKEELLVTVSLVSSMPVAPEEQEVAKNVAAL